MATVHEIGEIIAQQYRIVDILGQGGVGITYAAEDIQSQKQVALKVLSFKQAKDWKQIELFEREAKILAQLQHRAIPRYLNSFQVDTERDRTFYIVQQLAPGQSLATQLQAGWRPTEKEARYIATKLLEALVYLQRFKPPIIHRDIKPHNIIRQANGQIYLVDFGAVQDTYYHTIAQGSTVVGTFGYMAPEQFRGQACPATDLYGLGATLVSLLSGQDPANLPQRQLKLQFRSEIDVSPAFADWLERLLEPALEDRFTSANVAFAVLKGKRPAQSVQRPKATRPPDSPISLTQSANALLLDIPPVQLRTPISRKILTCASLWLGTWIFMLWFSIGAHLQLGLIGVGLMLLGLCGGGLMLCDWYRWATLHTTLDIRDQVATFNFSGLGKTLQVSVQSRTLTNVNFHPIYAPFPNHWSICPWFQKQTGFYFGMLLTRREQLWLQGELHTFALKHFPS